MGFKRDVENKLFNLNYEVASLKAGIDSLVKENQGLREALDLLMAHLDLAFDTEPAKAEKRVIRPKKEVDKKRKEEAERLKKERASLYEPNIYGSPNIWPGVADRGFLVYLPIQMRA